MANPAPDDVAVLKAALAAAVQRADWAEADAAAARAQCADDQALIAHLKLLIAKYRRERFGVSSERTGRRLDQVELQLEGLEAGAAEDELAAEKAAARASAPVTAFSRRIPARQSFPDHLPRERVVIEAPGSCACCGGLRLRKLGEDITETLEVIPRQWKVIHVVFHPELSRFLG